MDKNKLSIYQSEREGLLDQITKSLQEDSRVSAVWLFGSLGRDDADALSDIDIWVVIADDHIQDVVNHRQKFVAQISQPIFFVEASQNAPQDGGYLMAYYDMFIGPHQVDWYWQPQSLAYIPSETHVLFERIGLTRNDQSIEFPNREPIKEFVENPLHFISYFWAMLLITAKYVPRKPPTEEMRLLPYVLQPFHKTQQILGQNPTTNHMLQTARREKLTVLRRLADEMCVFMPQIAAQGYVVPDAAPTAVYKFLDLMEEVYQ